MSLPPLTKPSVISVTRGERVGGLTSHENSSLPTIEQAERTLLNLFGDPQVNELVPPITTSLLSENVVYSQAGGNELLANLNSKRTLAHWQIVNNGGWQQITKTNKESPDSPIIPVSDISGAQIVYTATIEHFWLGFGPQLNLVFAREGAISQPTFRVYRCPKGHGVVGKTDPAKRFVEIVSFADPEVAQLVTHSPSEGGKPLIALWKQEPNADYYLAKAAFVSTVSLANLIQIYQEVLTPSGTGRR